jgi:hypothetical protein
LLERLPEAGRTPSPCKVQQRRHQEQTRLPLAGSQQAGVGTTNQG